MSDQAEKLYNAIRPLLPAEIQLRLEDDYQTGSIIVSAYIQLVASINVINRFLEDAYPGVAEAEIAFQLEASILDGIKEWLERLNADAKQPKSDAPTEPKGFLRSLF